MSEIQSDINKIIKVELQKWFPTLELKDGWDWHIQQISADSCVAFTEHIAQKVFEATKQVFIEKATLLVIYNDSDLQTEYLQCFETKECNVYVSNNSILNLKIEDLVL